MINNYVNSQFHHPKGLFGCFVGVAMAKMYNDRLGWTVEMLNVRPQDHILEIGFGPGVALQKVSEWIEDGLVAGVDISRMMHRQASKRNKKAIREGQIKLELGSVHDMPFPDEQFDKVFAINSFHHWPQPQEKNLAEIRRVLKDRGVISITEQPHWIPTDKRILEIAEEYKTILSNVGFRDVDVFIKSFPIGLCFIVQGFK